MCWRHLKNIDSSLQWWAHPSYKTLGQLSICFTGGVCEKEIYYQVKDNNWVFWRDQARLRFDVKVIVEMDEIPPNLNINWDQTGIHYVPVGSWTMVKEWSKRVEIVAIDDKWQSTAVFCCFIDWTLFIHTLDLSRHKWTLPSICPFLTKAAYSMQ